MADQQPPARPTKPIVRSQKPTVRPARKHFHLPTPAEGATALITVVMNSNSDRRTPTEGLPRGRLTRTAYLTCLRRNVITESFFNDLQAELGIRGYAIIDIGDVVALIPEATVRKWLRIRSDKVQDVVAAIDNGTFDFVAKDQEIRVALAKQIAAADDDE